jgi:hypothetical protein
MHALQLWPRMWLGGRPLTQVEEIVAKTQREEIMGPWPDALPPEEQLKQMREDAQRILDSYERPYREAAADPWYQGRGFWTTTRGQKILDDYERERGFWTTTRGKEET